MRHFPFASVLLAILISALPARAQQADEAWKKLFTQSMYFAGAKDYAKAEETLVSALHEAERFGTSDLRVASTENTMGLVYLAQNKFGEAEAAYRRALVIFEQAYGSDSIDVANVDFNIATVMFDQGHQAEAMPYIQKARGTYESLLGGTSLKTASALCMEGDADRVTKNFTAAEGLLRRCGDIRESDGGMQNTELADALYSLALVYVGQGKYGLAEPRFKLAEKIRESTLGLTSPLLAETMEAHAALLKSMGRNEEADKLIVLSAAIRRNQKKNK
jgi:tetratricopeptide (TPR) repeat protein